MKKVNLGSGTTCLDDWINIDSSFNARLAKYPRLRYLLYKVGILLKVYYEVPWLEHIPNIMVRDLRKKLPFEDDSIDFIYSSHSIEHLKKDDAERLLRECFRVLKEGGLIRLIVPDLELAARNYIKKIEEIRNNREKLDYHPSERFLDLLGSCEKTRTPLTLRIFSSGSRHRWMYDQLSLTALLESCGFVDIQKRSYKVGGVPDIEFLDNRPADSLWLEARKTKGVM